MSRLILSGSGSVFARLLIVLWLVAINIPAYSAENEASEKQEAAWTAKDLAVIVNDNDPLSVQIGDYYRRERKIPANQLIHVKFKPGAASMPVKQFIAIKSQVDKQTPAHVQGYLQTWTMPYRVGCMSITTAFAAGFDPAFCAKGCKETRHNPFYDSASNRPYTDFNWRPAMVLAAENFAEARQLIDRGKASDYSNPKSTAYLLQTSDAARSSRAGRFPEYARQFKKRLPVNYLRKNFIEGRQDVMFYFTGLSHVQKIATNHYLPGAVADHLTSGGGILKNSYQMSIMEWLRAGVTGSYGAVVEPCNFPAKFSDPGVLMQYYLNGSTLIEAYWKSVAQPGQGIFVGEPLAKPFARKPN